MTMPHAQAIDLKPGEQAPPLVKIAHNTSTASENKIHDDGEARRLGLRGGLVPGVTLYAYLTEHGRPLLGPAGLERGTSSVRFVRPVYEGDQVTCTAARRGSGAERAGGIALELSVIGPDGSVCVTGLASLEPTDAAAFTVIGLGSLTPTDRLDAGDRLLLTPDNAPIGVPLQPRTVTIDAEAVAAYANEADDPNPWYRGGSPFGLPLVPPALLASQPARWLREHFSYGPSVHTGSEIRHLGRALAGGTYRVGGKLVEVYSKRGNDYLVADVQIEDHNGIAVMQIHHTVVFRFVARN